MVLNFTTIQRLTSLKSLFYWDIKKRVLEEGEGKNEIEKRRNRQRNYHQYENWLNMSLCIAKYFQPIMYSIFFIYYFIKKYSILFHIKWINQSISFIFLQIIILIKLFPLIYLIIKILPFFSKTLFIVN